MQVVASRVQPAAPHGASGDQQHRREHRDTAADPPGPGPRPVSAVGGRSGAARLLDRGSHAAYGGIPATAGDRFSAHPRVPVVGDDEPAPGVSWCAVPGRADGTDRLRVVWRHGDAFRDVIPR
ncbi:hypothetical protein GCM10023223_42850 [Stackebrandtia albiflava]